MYYNLYKTIQNLNTVKMIWSVIHDNLNFYISFQKKVEITWLLKNVWQQLIFEIDGFFLQGYKKKINLQNGLLVIE